MTTQAVRCCEGCSVPSALEAVEDKSEKDKGVGVVPAESRLKGCRVAVKKIKMQQPWVPLGEVQPPPQVVEHSMLHHYMQAELVDLGSQVGRSLWSWYQLGSFVFRM